MYVSKSKRKLHSVKTFIIISILAITVILSIVFLNMKPYKNKELLYEGVVFDSACEPYKGDWNNSGNSTDNFSYSYNKSPIIKNERINLNLVSPSQNTVFMVAEVMIEEGDTLYTSEYIPPGYTIKKDNIQTKIKKGTYNGVIYIYAVSIEKQEILSSKSHEITIAVE